MRIDPDSEENQAATRQNEREVFALQMQAKQDAEAADQTCDELCCVCGEPITDSVIYTTTDLAFRWHVRCDKDRLKRQRAQAFVRTIAARAEREAKP